VHALILAAGGGSRLGSALPKCLAEIGGRPLLHHQLDALAAVGVDDVTVVAGHRAEAVSAAVDGDVRLVHNDIYDETNSLYSFWLARGDVTGDDVVLLNSDVLFPAELLHRLLSEPTSALAYDATSGDDAEHMKVHASHGFLQRMSKALPAADTDGENVGVLHLTEEVADAAFDSAGWLVGEGSTHEWVGAAITDVAARHPIACHDVSDLPWVEIDFPHDLEHARTDVWPAVAALPTAVPAHLPTFHREVTR
jgi:choline kinase